MHDYVTADRFANINDYSDERKEVIIPLVDRSDPRS